VQAARPEATIREEGARVSVSNHRPAAVYRLFTEDGTLLYIGSAYDPDHRCASHRKKVWWPQVARRTEEWHPSRGAAYSAEMAAIASEGAVHNEMGTPSYRTPDTEAIRERKRLASTRQRLISESWRVEAEVRHRERENGSGWTAADIAATRAGIDFLEATGLFKAAVKERRRRLAARLAPAE
jgi:predicted GIY-YIG superfamily endonuclease